MNVPAAVAAVVAPRISGEVMLLPLADLVPSSTHIQELRRARFDKKALEDLAESVRKVGVLQPIVVRPHPAPSGAVKYEIVAGERRWCAARIAGLQSIYARTAPLSDDQVIEVQLIENLQREGLHELEEAEGYGELMRLKKISAEVLAELVGKSRGYVYARTKLLALCPEARKAFYDGALDASRALLIARIGHHNTQREALKDLIDSRFGRGPMPYRDALAHIQHHYMLRLKDAPFDPEDAQIVPNAGPCAACPKRTGNQKELFGDVKYADVCTDPKCFDDKRQAHFADARKAIEAKGKKVLSGDAAKKLFPHWKSGNSHIGHGYLLLTETTYASGRPIKVGALLGKDYDPILVQHPLNGKIVEVAAESAIAKRSKNRGGVARTQHKTAKPKGPDVDEMLTERLAQLIHKNAPRQFGRTWLLDLARVVFEKLSLRDGGAIAKAFSWPVKAFGTGGYTKKLPPQANKLDERGLVLLMFLLVFATRWEREPVLRIFGVKERLVRESIIEERKKAAATAKMAAKTTSAPTAKPAAKTKPGKR